MVNSFELNGKMYRYSLILGFTQIDYYTANKYVVSITTEHVSAPVHLTHLNCSWVRITFWDRRSRLGQGIYPVKEDETLNPMSILQRYLDFMEDR